MMSREMRDVSKLAALRAQVRQWRAEGLRIGFVPTMGNLHAGHLALVAQARQRADRCVVSIFVNPMQFGEGEDFAAYPRTLESDRQQLTTARADLLFIPEVAEIYPQGQTTQTRVEVPDLSDILCGASRPGHFVGVATVVCKLLNMVQPDLALFGEKDYQQLLVIRRMVEDLAIPVKIEGIPIVREADGLAMSSRNGYLSPQQRRQAPHLYRVLQQIAQAIAAGRRDYPDLEQQARAELHAAGLRPEYVSVRRASDLAPPGPTDRQLRVLAAAYLGQARLIDNLSVSRGPQIDR
jgi:pantoate--beta-alanine ligase